MGYYLEPRELWLFFSQILIEKTIKIKTLLIGIMINTIPLSIYHNKMLSYL